jgi:hypothetical protein
MKMHKEHVIEPPLTGVKNVASHFIVEERVKIIIIKYMESNM